MLISRQKKKENIIEYILYMWQIEDLIRAYNFDLVAIEREIISQFDLDGETHREMVEWYDNLIQLMINEDVQEKGHIQAIKNIVEDLSRLHSRLLESPFVPEYKEEFENLLPYIKELLTKTNIEDKNLVEILIEALYGYLLLKISKAKISKQTQEATEKISNFLSLLAKMNHQYENDPDFSL